MKKWNLLFVMLLVCSFTFGLTLYAEAQIVPEIIDMHHDSLRGTGYGAYESGILTSKIVISTTAKGALSLTLNSTTDIYQNQLIVIVSGEEYYTNVIKSKGSNVINLAYPLETDVAVSDKVYNFYSDNSHPNTYGYRAIADETIRSLQNDYEFYNHGTHLMLGDSWFESTQIMERFSERFPGATFINFGVGGNKIDNLYRRFTGTATSSDIKNDYVHYGDRINATTIQTLDFVWVMGGTNDYWANTPSADFKSVMNDLINSIINRGSQPIVFTSSVGQIGVNQNYALSKEYANIFYSLNTYESGVWTPVLGGSTIQGNNTYSSQSGTYLKIGKLVIAQFDLTLSVKDTSMSGPLKISGLPYNVASPFFSPTYAHVENLFLRDQFSQYAGYCSGNNIFVTQTAGSSGSWDGIDATATNNSTKITGSIIYITN